MTIRGGGHPKQAMVSTPFSRMGPPPRSFAADAHDCIMVRDPRDRPNTRVWRDDPRPMASSPLIVEARLSPSNLSSSLRTRSDDGACSGNRGVWPAHPRQQGDRAASAPGQVESHLGRTRLTSDAPYKGLLTPIHSHSSRLTRRWLDLRWQIEPNDDAFKLG